MRLQPQIADAIGQIGNLIQKQSSFFSWSTKRPFPKRVCSGPRPAAGYRQSRFQKRAVARLTAHRKGPANIGVQDLQHAGVLNRRRHVLREVQKEAAEAPGHC